MMDEAWKPRRANTIIGLRKEGRSVSYITALVGASLLEIAAALEFYNCPDATGKLPPHELERLDELDELALMSLQADDNSD